MIADVGITIFCDPMIKPIAKFAENSPIFNDFLQKAMRQDKAIFVQTIDKSRLAMHVTDFVLHEYYRHMGA